MHVEVRTDSHVQGGLELTQRVESAVLARLARFGDWITRVDVHLSDENSSEKTHNNPMRCRMEARPAGRQPVAASADAATLEQAIDGAANKMERVLDGVFGRLNDNKGRTSASGDMVG